MFNYKPKTFDNCIEYARNRFQKYFVNDIRQLIYTYPLDKVTKQGQLFWSLPKRPPKELIFSEKDELHARFIASTACLWAKIFGIKTPQQPRSIKTIMKIAEKAA